MGSYLLWTVEDLKELSINRRQNKFDTIVCITGRRGMSKSTLGVKLGYKLHFQPERDLVYDRDNLLEALEGWDRFIDADEIINSAYKREFYDLDQIELIKILNMYRDHRHVIVFCIPNFWDLDKPLRDIVSLRIDMVRRGFGVLHKPLSLAYTNDPWDQKYNEKVERSWLSRGGRTKAKYWKLTTFIGFIRFGPLDPRQEEAYQRIKDERRAGIKAKKQAIKEAKINPQTNVDPKKELYERTLKLVKDKRIQRSELDMIAFANGIKRETFWSALNKMLKDEAHPETLWQLLPKVTKRKLITSTVGGTDELGYPQALSSSKED